MLLEISPRHLVGLRIWGNALFFSAPRKPLAEANRLFSEAGEKLSSALSVAPGDPDVMANLAFTLLRRAELDQGAPAHEFVARARELCEAAFEIRPDFEYARILWARALGQQAKRFPGGEMVGVLAEAREYFKDTAVTAGVTSANLRGIALILLAQAIEAAGDESVRLLRQAKRKFIEAETLEPGTGAYRAACVCARLDEQAECRHWLEQSQEPGRFITGEEVAAEPHFRSVRDYEWFQELLASSGVEVRVGTTT
jgi:hypothetical protein